MKTLPPGQKPYFDTDKRPEEILGDSYGLFVRHYRAWHKYDGSEKAMSKAFSEDERKLIGELKEKLLYNGYIVNKILESGEIKWYVITRSIQPKIKSNNRKIPVKKLVEDIGEEMPEGELG